MRRYLIQVAATWVILAIVVTMTMAQPGGEVTPDPIVPWWKMILAMSGIFLPMLGRVLVMIPFVTNKMIPAINAALAIMAKLAIFGLSTDGSFDLGSGASGGVLMAAFNWQMIVSVAWGLGEQFLAQTLYENRKAKSKVASAMGTAAPFMAWLVPKSKRV